MKTNKFGLLTEEAEKELISSTAKFKHVVVHFYHPEFRRCGIMNGHLQTLAQKFFSTKFFKIQVEQAPFLVEKLKIKVLPCVVLFIDGISVDRVIGFEELGDRDDFPTINLERRLMKSGVIFGDRKMPTNTWDRPVLGFPESNNSDDEFD